MRFSHKLILLYSVLLFSTSALVGFVVQTSTAKILESRIREGLEEDAFHTMQEIDQMLYERYLDLRELSSDSVLSSRTAAAAQIRQRLDAYLMKHPCYSALSLFDLDRVRIADTAGNDVGRQHPSTEFLTQIGRGKEFVVTIAASSGTNAPVLYGAHLVKDAKGHPSAVLTARMPVEVLYEIVQRHGSAVSETATRQMELLAEDGLILFSTYEKNGILKRVSEDWEEIKDLVESGMVAGSERHLWRKAEEITAFSREKGYREFKGSRWVLVLCTPTKTALAPVAAQRNLVLKVIFVVGGFAFIAVALVAQGMTRPLGGLSRAAREIGTGNLDVRVEQASSDEIGDLARSFNAMAAGLKAGEKKWRDVAELLPQMVFETDMRGVFTYVNRFSYEISGYATEDIVKGMSALQLIVPEDRERARGSIERRLRGEPVGGVEYVLLRKDGSTFPVLLFANPIVIENQIRGLRGIAIDITERKRAEWQINNAKEEWERTFDAIKDPVMILDAGHRIVRANKAMAEKLHVTPAGAVGQVCYEAVHGLERPPEFCPHAKLLVDGEPHDAEIFEERLAGHYYVSVSPLHTPDGTLAGSVHYAHDITRQKKAEDDIRRLNENLERTVAERTRQLLDAQEELVRNEKLAFLGQLAGSVGHELRNPLGVMSNAVYYLKTLCDAPDGEAGEYLDIIKAEIENCQRIIGDLLDLGRIRMPRATKVSAVELVGAALAKCVVPESVLVRLDLPASLRELSVDPLQVGQVFQNLILNAVQAMPAGGALTVSAELEREAPAVRIRVSDTGEGILPENMAKLFQPLFTTKARGIGLGLALSKQLVEANGGRIEFESSVGAGTTFSVILPTSA